MVRVGRAFDSKQGWPIQDGDGAPKPIFAPSTQNSSLGQVALLPKPAALKITATPAEIIYPIREVIRLALGIILGNDVVAFSFGIDQC